MVMMRRRSFVSFFSTSVSLQVSYSMFFFPNSFKWEIVGKEVELI